MALTQVDQGLLSSTAQYTGFKNRIINGAMMIDQRNAGASLTVSSNTLKYCVDRFGFQPVSASMSVQRTGSSGGPYSLQITGNTGSTGFNVIQKIESYNIADLAGQTVTLSFTISSAVLTSANAYYQTPTAQDNFGSLNTLTSIGAFSISSTPTQKSLTFTLPASAVNGLLLFVINGGALTSGTVTITGVQLEKGSTATSFDYRPYGTELALCQRYYWKPATEPIGLAATGFGAGGRLNNPVPMRSAATISGATFSVNTGSAGTVTSLYQTVNGQIVYNSANNWTTNAAVSVNGEVSAEL